VFTFYKKDDDMLRGNHSGSLPSSYLTRPSGGVYASALSEGIGSGCSLFSFSSVVVLALSYVGGLFSLDEGEGFDSSAVFVGVCSGS
jgi:hypothetical protein